MRGDAGPIKRVARSRGSPRNPLTRSDLRHRIHPSKPGVTGSSPVGAPFPKEFRESRSRRKFRGEHKSKKVTGRANVRHISHIRFLEHFRTFSIRAVLAVAHLDRALVEPGFFRTELLTNDSTTYAQPTIDDYVEQTKEIVAAWKSMDGKQGGDPAKLAHALVKLVELKEPPTRFAAGADAVQTFETKAKALLAQANAHPELSTSLAYDDA
jgi:hypothetical protein